MEVTESSAVHQPNQLRDRRCVENDSAGGEAVGSSECSADVEGVSLAEWLGVGGVNELVVQGVARVRVGDGEAVGEFSAALDDLS